MDPILHRPLDALDEEIRRRTRYQAQARSFRGLRPGDFPPDGGQDRPRPLWPRWWSRR